MIVLHLHTGHLQNCYLAILNVLFFNHLGSLRGVFENNYLLMGNYVSYLSEIIEQYYDKKLGEGQCVLLDKTTHPPRLLICYSSSDGPAHVRVVLQLAAFLQKHMATQVSDLGLNQTEKVILNDLFFSHPSLKGH